jgi:hypothetical protein
MDKKLKEVRNAFDAIREVLLSSECERVSKFLSVVGNNSVKEVFDIESAIAFHYDFSVLSVKGSIYFIYRRLEENDLQEHQLYEGNQPYKGYEDVGDDMINYVITFFRDTCSFGFALMSERYDYLDGNNDGAKKERLSFLKSNRYYLCAISVSDIDLSNYEEIPYLKPNAVYAPSFSSRFVKRLNKLNKP